jgi:hypothetical protein
MKEAGFSERRVNLEALQALQADAVELERIVNLLDRFNVFESIGFVSQELMHSRFLSFLLDPRQNHGFGDCFLKRVLRQALASTDNTSLPAIENLEEIDLNQTVVIYLTQHSASCRLHL